MTKLFSSLFLGITFLLTPFLLSAQAYLNPSLAVEERVEDLLSRMTLAEKIGQMTQAERNMTTHDIQKYFLGSVLNGGGSVPSPNTPVSWPNMIDGMQDYAMTTPLKIPILFATDAVHGHGNLKNATIFLHNIGMGANGNLELAYEHAKVAAKEIRATGVHWTFAPCLAVARNEKWGGTYQVFIYPNPSSKEVDIRLSELSKMKLSKAEIYNV